MIVLFDLDGTVIDSTEAIVESFSRALRIYGYPQVPRTQIVSLIGHPLDTMFLHTGVEEERVHDFVVAYKAHYRRIACEKTRLLPGAREAIEYASEFAKLGVVTTKTARYSKEMLDYMGILGYFETLVGREDVTFPKPHPEPIHTALRRMGHVSQTVWMIGDTPMDMEAALAAKVKPVGVTCGYAEEAVLRRYTSDVFENSREAVKYIIETIR